MESAADLYVAIVMCRANLADAGDYDRPVMVFLDAVGAAEWIADNAITLESNPYYVQILPIADVMAGPETISVRDINETETAASDDAGIYCCDEERVLYALLGDLVVALQGVPGPVFGPARP